MDELPELRSDEEVDALLARLRAKVAPPTTHRAPTQIVSDSSGHALTELLSAQAEATKAIVRALQVLAEAVEELEGPRAPGPRTAEGPRPGLSSKASSGASGLRPPPQRASVRVGGPGPAASRRRQ